MFPTVLQVGPIVISCLGMALVVGLFFSIFLFWQKAREEHFEEEKLMDMAILVSLAALFGARTGWILTNFPQLEGTIGEWFDFVGKPGFWWFGGLSLGILTIYYLSRKNKWDFFKISDIVCFGLTLFLIFEEIGFFLDGSNYGKATNLPWGLRFPGLLEKHHPLQLYRLIILILLFRLVFWLEKNYRTFIWYQDKKGETKEGFISAVFLICFGLMNFSFGFLKESEIFLKWMSIDQWFGLLTSMSGAFILYIRSGKKIEFGKRDKQKSPTRRAKTKFRHFKAGIDAITKE